MRKLIFILLIMCTGNSYANGEYNGNNLASDLIEYEKYQRGKNYDRAKSSYYSGYINGVADMTMDVLFCAPENGLMSVQMNKVVAKFLNDNPARLHQYAGVLVGEALKIAFPCKK